MLASSSTKAFSFASNAAIRSLVVFWQSSSSSAIFLSQSSLTTLTLSSYSALSTLKVSSAYSSSCTLFAIFSSSFSCVALTCDSRSSFSSSLIVPLVRFGSTAADRYAKAGGRLTTGFEISVLTTPFTVAGAAWTTGRSDFIASATLCEGQYVEFNLLESPTYGEIEP